MGVLWSIATPPPDCRPMWLAPAVWLRASDIPSIALFSAKRCARHSPFIKTICKWDRRWLQSDRRHRSKRYLHITKAARHSATQRDASTNMLQKYASSNTQTHARRVKIMFFVNNYKYTHTRGLFSSAHNIHLTVVYVPVNVTHLCKYLCVAWDARVCFLDSLDFSSQSCKFISHNSVLISCDLS